MTGSGQDQPSDPTVAEGALGSDSGAVTKLEPSLWQALSKAQGFGETAQAWTPLMFDILERVEICSVLRAEAPGGRLMVPSSWPRGRYPGGSLISAAESALREGRGVVRGAMAEGSDNAVAVAVPLMVDGAAIAAVGFEARGLNRDALQELMRKLQWGAAWMRDTLRAEASASKDRRYAQAAAALHVVTTVAEQDGFNKSARAAVTDLATRFDCDRVSVGFRRLRRCRVAAISHSAEFVKEMNLVRMLGAAMDEAIDQRGVVIWPDRDVDEPMATHRHELLAKEHSVGNILTCPLYSVDRFVGAVVFERPADHPFTEADAEILEAVATVIAPVLDEVRRNDRWLITKAGGSFLRFLGRLLGPGYLLRKLILLAIIGVVTFFWFARSPDRVNADARVEGAIQRAVTAPFDGFIATSDVRAGDAVAEGDVLVQLDNRELTLERLRLSAQLELERIEYQSALAEQNRAEVLIRGNSIAQAETQIALIDEQLERTTLRAPFDGIVASGDLSQSIGASVARGETLMTVVPNADYRVVLQVDERRIADVVEGQSANLVVTALPERVFPLDITRITPVAEYGDGRTTFRVDAALAAPAMGLQPGMEGVAKIEAGERRLIGVWSRSLIDWMRLKTWLWLGVVWE